MDLSRLPGFPSAISVDVMLQCMPPIDSGADEEEPDPVIPAAMRPLPDARAVTHHSCRILAQTVSLADVSLDRRMTGDSFEYTGSCFNTCNHWEWTPFLASSDEIVQVDPTWWSSLPMELQTRIAAAVKVNKAAQGIKVPHASELRTINCCHRVYDIYNKGFEFACWRSMIPNVVLVPLNCRDRRSLAAIALRRVSLGGGAFQPDDIEQVSAGLLEKLSSAIRSVGGRAFAKTADKSAKNDVKLQAHTRPESILDELTSSKDVLVQSLASKEAPATYLVLKPWKDEVDAASEFRAIIIDRQLAGISQQFWYKSVGHTCDSVVSLVQPVIDLWYDKLLPLCPYADCVLDVYVTKGEAHLIEVNPCGCWASSGSSLFHWISDRDLLLDPCVLPVRVVVPSPDSSTITVDPPYDIA